MQITRSTAPADHVSDLGERAACLPQCIGCKGCTGLCAALLEMIALPEAVLGCSKEVAG